MWRVWWEEAQPAARPPLLPEGHLQGRPSGHLLALAGAEVQPCLPVFPRQPRKTLKLKKFLNLNKTKFFKIKNYDLDILNLKKQNINKIKILIKIKLLRKLK